MNIAITQTLLESYHEMDITRQSVRLQTPCQSEESVPQIFELEFLGSAVGSLLLLGETCKPCRESVTIDIQCTFIKLLLWDQSNNIIISSCKYVIAFVPSYLLKLLFYLPDRQTAMFDSI